MSAEMGVGVIILAVFVGWLVMGAIDRYVQQQRQARVYEQLQREWIQQKANQAAGIDLSHSQQPIYDQLRYEVECVWLADDIAAFEAGERP